LLRADFLLFSLTYQSILQQEVNLANLIGHNPC